MPTILRCKAQGNRVNRLRRHYAALSVSHYVVEVIDHRYQHALDLVIHLLEDLMTAVRPDDGR